jgi:HPr kinase/phosphorylase
MEAAPASSAQGLRVYATTVALGSGAAVMLRGLSGAGKSDLALRFLSGQSQWPGMAPERYLIADDQTCLTRIGNDLLASPPPGFAGLVEVRGLGIATVPSVASAVIKLVVDLVPPSTVERYPLAPETVCLGWRCRFGGWRLSKPVRLSNWHFGSLE